MYIHHTKYTITRCFGLIFGLMLLVLVSSCQDEEEITVSSECYISSVTLGGMKRYVTTNVDGKETTYVVTYSGSYYRMSIDQTTNPGTIRNPEPLLYRTIVGNTLLNIAASGTVLYRPSNQLAESWLAYSPTDSIDLSVPIFLRVIASNGVNYRDYKLSLNVRQNDPNGFTWDSLEVAAPFEAYKRLKVVQTASGVAAMAADANGVNRWLSQDTLKTWNDVTATAADAALSRADVETLTLWDNHLWVSTADGVLLTADADNTGWAVVPGAPSLRIVTARDSLYALGAGSKMLAMGQDRQWHETDCDEPDQLPASDAVGVAYEMPSGDDRLMMIGRLGDASTVWGRTLGRVTGQWVHYCLTPENSYALPLLTDMSIASYNRELVAIGGDLSAAYISVDNGITWKRDYDWGLPPALGKVAGPAALMADDDNNLWLLRGKVVYRGRANTLKE